MALQALPISTVINVSVATPQIGIGAYNTANIALFSRETPTAAYGAAAYKIYLSATQVGLDWGTSSNTYQTALGIFGQQPNIFNNSGYVVIVPYLSGAQTALQTVSYPTLPTAGAYTLSYSGNATTSLAFGSNAATIQTALRALTGLSSVTVTGSPSVGFIVTFTGVSGAAATLVVGANTLTDANSAAVIPLIAVTQIGSSAETLDSAVIRTQGLVQYFGVLPVEVPPTAVVLQAAALIQTLNKLLFIVSYTPADIASGGMLDLVRTGGLTQTRTLYYGDVLSTALNFMGAYASLGLSTNFGASLSTQTMNLKTLSGVQPDPSMTATLAVTAAAAGADIYASIQGVPKVVCSMGNDFFDNQFNLQWFAGAVQVAGFNYLAQTNSKVPQTETGMDGLKGAVRNVCEQGITNGFIAAGSWTSSTTFGVQTDFLANILQRGYYIYATPIAQQLQATRAARVAPPIQVALKYAGAIHSGSIVIYVNP